MPENELTKTVIGAAIEVHRWLGSELLEGVYEEALCHELHLLKLPFRRQQRVPIHYKDVRLASDLRLDLLVDERIIVDVKAKQSLSPTDKPQLLTYLRLCNLRVGVIINFHVLILREGITRVTNGFSNERTILADPPDFHAPSILH